MDIYITTTNGLDQEAKDWIMATLQEALDAQATEIKTHLDAADARYKADLQGLRDQVTALQAQVTSVNGDPSPVVKAAFAGILSAIDQMDTPVTLPPSVLPPTDPNAAPATP